MYTAVIDTYAFSTRIVTLRPSFSAAMLILLNHTDRSHLSFLFFHPLDSASRNHAGFTLTELYHDLRLVVLEWAMAVSGLFWWVACEVTAA